MESKRPAYLFFSLLVFLLAICVVLVQQSSAGGRLRPSPTAVASAPTELVNRLRADAFTYFRFVNRSWAARVCDAFHDVSDLPIVRLHGDAHVEQYALTDNAWGLTDFDDSARGPEFIDIVRFLGSIDLATRQRGWTSDRDALWDRSSQGIGSVSPILPIGFPSQTLSECFAGRSDGIARPSSHGGKVRWNRCRRRHQSLSLKTWRPSSASYGSSAPTLGVGTSPSSVRDGCAWVSAAPRSGRS